MPFAGDARLRKCLILFVALILIPAALALQECQSVITASDVPCQVTTTWNYTPPCDDYTASIYNQSGDLLASRTLGNFSGTGLCNFTFNYTDKGSYTFLIDSGDTGSLTVEEDEDMILGLIIGIGIVAALLLWFSFNLDPEHGILKLLLQISAITVVILIPVSTFIQDNIGQTFYRLFLYIYVAFWIYVSIYFFYWLYQRMRKQVAE